MVPRTKLDPSHGWVQQRQRTGCPPLPSKQLMHTADKNCVRPSTFTWNETPNWMYYRNVTRGITVVVRSRFARYTTKNEPSEDDDFDV